MYFFHLLAQHIQYIIKVEESEISSVIKDIQFHLQNMQTL